MYLLILIRTYLDMYLFTVDRHDHTTLLKIFSTRGSEESASPAAQLPGM
jgi:hypothetical protein